MLYQFNNDYVLRDIAGIYFAVNIADKNVYLNKKIYSVNLTAFALLGIAQKRGCFSVQELLEEFVLLLKGDNIDRSVIYADITSFCEDSVEKGMLKYGK